MKNLLINPLTKEEFRLGAYIRTYIHDPPCIIVLENTYFHQIVGVDILMTALMAILVIVVLCQSFRSKYASTSHSFKLLTLSIRCLSLIQISNTTYVRMYIYTYLILVLYYLHT